MGGKNVVDPSDLADERVTDGKEGALVPKEGDVVHGDGERIWINKDKNK